MLRNDAARFTRNNVMFAPHAPQGTSCATAHIIPAGYIICLSGQTSFKNPTLVLADKCGIFVGAAGGIRTHGTVASTPDFESGPL